jgi:hypothetical protein
MLALSPERILQIATAVASIQKKLLQVFFLENPGVVDFKLLTDFPKRGVLTVDGEVWSYVKHGLGYSFSSERGRVIDMHNHFGKDSRLIDAHRLTEYLLSLEERLAELEDLYSLVEGHLITLQQQGFMEKIADQPLAWELAISS